MSRFLPVLALLVAAPFAPAAAQRPVIDSIVIETRNVFNADEASRNVMFRVANGMRVATQTGVVYRELLFRVGDRYDAALVAETERNLRGMRLFREVRIDTMRVAGRLVVRVVTADGWSTNLNLSGRSTGGVFTWSAGLTEQNVLGTGNSAGIGYRRDADRNALRVRARIRRVGSTRLVASGFYEDLTDGAIGGWALESPFRALDDPFAVGLSGEAARQRVLQFRDGALATESYRRALVQRGLAMYSVMRSPSNYIRIGLDGHVRREEYVALADTGLTIPDSVFGTIGGFAEWLHPRFLVVRHYNGFARDEDVDLSARVTAGLWLAPAVFGHRDGGVVPAVDAQMGVPLGGAGFLRLEGHAHGLLTGVGLDSGQVRGALTVAVLALPRQATVLRVEGGLKRNPVPGAEFDLGHGIGPRAFGPHAFTGTRSIWGTLEHRVFALDELFNVLGLGFAAFVDYGGAWYEDQAARLGGDVGVGLRLGPTRSTGPNVGRIDVAYTFGDGVGAKRWVVSVGRSHAF